jgi:hypothetical protein
MRSLHIVPLCWPWNYDGFTNDFEVATTFTFKIVQKKEKKGNRRHILKMPGHALFLLLNE